MFVDFLVTHKYSTSSLLINNFFLYQHSTPSGSAKSFDEIQKEQEEAMKRATTSITQNKRTQQLPVSVVTVLCECGHCSL